jgi:F-type H+-transporting ATPase subunit epsilon
MRIHHEQGIDRYYVEGGFVEVLHDVVSVLTNRAMPAAEIDEAVVEEQLLASQSRPATTPEAMAIRTRTQQQCRAQLRVVRRTR